MNCNKILGYRGGYFRKGQTALESRYLSESSLVAVNALQCDQIGYLKSLREIRI